jgi:predicted RNase H-like nuclease
MIGLYPAPRQEAASADNSLAKTLLRRLGLRENPTLDNPVTKVYEVEPMAEGDTVK